MQPVETKEYFVTTPTKLLGENRTIGEVISADDIPENVLPSLVSSGVLSVEPPQQDANEQQSSEALEQARRTLADAEERITAADEALAHAKSQLDECRQSRKQLMGKEKFSKADEKELETLNSRSTTLLVDIENLEFSVEAAIERRNGAHNAVLVAEQELRRSNAKRLAQQTVEAAKKTEAAIAQLVPALDELRKSRNLFQRASGSNSQQLSSSWYLLSYIEEHALGVPQPTNKKVGSLHKFVERLLNDSINRMEK